MPVANGERHPSTGSWRSDKTITPGWEDAQAKSLNSNDWDYMKGPEDSPVSPRAVAKAAVSSRSAVAPWEQDDEPMPSPFTQPTRGNQQGPSRGSSAPAEPEIADPSDAIFHRNGTAMSPYRGDERRPSAASANTVSSGGSKSSQTKPISKKLQGFFGEDLSESKSVAMASTSANQATDSAKRPSATRSGSSIDIHDSGTPTQRESPSASRPRTPPQPSSDVTPWLYQDHEDINNYGNAPIRDGLTGPDSNRFERRTTTAPISDHRNHNHHHHHHHRLPFHRHRHHKSSDDHHAPPSRADTADSYFPPFNDSRQEGIANQMFGPSGPKDGKPSSTNSNSAETPPKNSGDASNHHGGKRSILDIFRRTHHGKPQIERAESLKSQPGSTTSLQQQAKAARESQQSLSPQSEQASIPPGTPTEPLSRQNTRPTVAPTPSKSHLVSSRISFRSKKSNTVDLPQMKDPNAADAGQNNNMALWNLDTDLQNMEGIISKEPAPKLTDQAQTPSWGIDEIKEEFDEIGGSWDAPDSWAVRKAMDDNLSRLKEIDETGEPQKDEAASMPYYIRIFRQDSTFATLSINLNTTASEIVQMLGKKFMVTEELNTYQIIMRKNNDTSRLLDGGERPVSIQKRLLEQAGYEAGDRIEDLGREDHSYLCAFKFLPAKAIGYSSLSKDPGFNKNQKFSNMDLTGRNLITIPIALYQKAGEIVFLNLSRNLSLDVPKDFIRSCINLREIKYTANEAWKLPLSFCLATKLTVLDLSNNRLEQLEHAELWRLENLASLKLANNKLSALPEYFSRLRTLRSLNLSSNLLTELPPSVSEISSLVDLDISFNSISSISELSKLVNLERIFATNNKLSGSPDHPVGDLKNLREVDIRFNSIDNIDTLSNLPQLEQLMAGHNSITSFSGSFAKIRALHLDHNPLTHFSLESNTPTLTTLNLASGKLSQIIEELFARITGLTKLVLDKNHLASISPQLGRLQKLDHLSVAKNALTTLPPEIGRLCELRFLDARENNISHLPGDLWFCRKLETLNLSSCVLGQFPKPPTQAALAGLDTSQANGSPQTPSSQSGAFEGSEEDDKVTDIAPSRRPSQASGQLSSSGSPAGSSYRKSSFASTVAGSRKPSLLTRTSTEGNASNVSRKDSLLITRTNATCIGSLRNLYLADNRLGEDVFDRLANLQELRVVNLSYNEIYEIPAGSIYKWKNLTEFYLSGNELSSLPCEDLEEISDLKILHLNSNKFQVLPAELGKLSKLQVLDVGSNILKYNVANYQYDWNWNCNPTLRYLNLSGNKRLEIKPPLNFHGVRDARTQTDFSNLSNLRVLGLMDVTLMIRQVPEQTENRRVRTAGSNIGTMGYGLADALGKQEHLSTLDLVVPRMEHEDETLIGLFDGASVSTGGSKTAAFLHEKFRDYFKTEMQRKQPTEDAREALRRTYLALNKDLALLATESQDDRERRASQPAQRTSIVNQNVTQEDLDAGCTAVVIFLQGMEMFVSNVGDAQAVLIKSDGGHKAITQKHDPANMDERRRIMEAGGYVSRQGKLNDALSVSRSFGFVPHMPSIVAAPTVSHFQIQETDEMILIASKELWDYLTPDFAVDLARSERNDLMRAAQKLRDIALAFGCQGRIVVMIIGVSDLRRKERARYRTHSMSMGPSGLPDEYLGSRSRGKRVRDVTLSSTLARLDSEVEAPVGEVSLVFTDIKNSTLMWETYPIAMQSAIRMHNEVMRRHLRLIGGYEVKTEGDAFMVAFPSVTSALLWCFTTQSQLLEVPWPQEILNSANGQELCDSDGNVLFKGLSVRMGIHWGRPVCEPDPVTRRMDYFGPMVNRAARISAVADGGQITVSSDFIAEIQRLLETHIESDRSSSAGSAEQLDDETATINIRRELRSLSSHGFEVKDLGERRLKGLENPEYIYLMYPHSLAGRLLIQQQIQQREEAEKKETAGQKSRDSQLNIDLDQVWDLWAVSLRLEMLCSTLENPSAAQLKAPETALLERTRERGGEVTDRFLINFVEHQVSRIETCITSLALRNMIKPFKDGMFGQACSMSDILTELSSQLSELKEYREQNDFEMAPS